MDTIGNLAAATPATRERYIDLLRAFSIGVVVIGHWLLAVVTLGDGTLTGRNALGLIDGVWILTWGLQVMPLFFFVGGFSNLRSWESTVRRGGGYASFLRARLTRLLQPTALFAAIWLIMARVLPALGAPRSLVEDMAATVAIPLWFMAVYLIVIALTPLAATAHHRFGIRVPIAFLLAALAVDVAARGFGVSGVGLLNFVWVWLLPHQLGFSYADGSLTRLPRRVHITIALTCLAGVAVLTATGLYAGSMVGMPGATDSNNSPPTFSLALHTIWMVGLAMALRVPAARWLERRGVWRAVIGINAVIMTVFLWHMTALVAGALILLPLGFPQPDVGTVAWWLLRPAWLIALATMLAPLVRLFGRIEMRSLAAARPAAKRAGAARTIAGTAFAITGIVTFAQLGFGSNIGATVAGVTITPMLGGIFLGAGMALLSAVRSGALRPAAEIEA